MNKIDLDNIGGFPLEQDTLKFMQDSYDDMFASIAHLLGDKVILSGVQVVGGNVTDGWIVYQGEIIKFQGGALGDDVVIIDTDQSAIFEDGNARQVYKTRIATIGAPGNFPFSDLKPVNVGVPPGTVVMWSGSVNNIPAGWQLFEALKGKFIVGFDPNDEDYNEIGKTGGDKSLILQSTHLPSQINVSITGKMIKKGGVANGVVVLDTTPVGGESADPSFGNKDVNTTMKIAGGSQPFDKRPTYYTIAYIIKL